MVRPEGQINNEGYLSKTVGRNMIMHITYSNASMSISAGKCRDSALRHGCDQSHALTSDFIDDYFTERHKETLSQSRGVGYWLWKPYIIYAYLNMLDDNDILVYTDAGILFEDSIGYVLSKFKDIMIFGNRWRHGDWCKREVQEGMGCTQFADREQANAACIIVSRKRLGIIKKWFDYCTLPDYINDVTGDEMEGFREHRHDQAILSNVAYLAGIKFHWWPAQYSLRYKKNYNDRYPVIFQHHRKRNDEW